LVSPLLDNGDISVKPESSPKFLRAMFIFCLEMTGKAISTPFLFKFDIFLYFRKTSLEKSMNYPAASGGLTQKEIKK
jgi:hypothetical protein